MVSKFTQQIFTLLVGVLVVAWAIVGTAQAQRVQDLTTLSGAPENRLFGYGLVVGLPGTGDRATQIPYTRQAIRNMLRQSGLRLDDNTFMQPRNVAAVMVTATVPPYTQRGQNIDVTVSAVGNAKSLRGGVLLSTPLKGSNGEVFAQAQGPVIVSGFSVGAAGTSKRVNIPTVGRVPDGAVLARGIKTNVVRNGRMKLLLDRPDYTTATRIARAIQAKFGPTAAVAQSPSVVSIHNPSPTKNVVAFMSQVQQLEVTPGQRTPTVVVDPQSGTVVMGQGVELGPAVVSHGNLTLRVQARNQIVQPGPFGNGRTAGVTNAAVGGGQGQAHVITLPHATTLGDITRALNAIGTTPADLIAILQALKSAGSLKAKLVIQ